MALDYSILNSKQVAKFNSDFDSSSQVEAVDLLSKGLNETAYRSGYYSAMIVTKYYIARPDLISLALYGTDKYGDIICKVNGISNPFELNEGDIIMYPTINDILEMVQVNPSRNHFVSPKDKEAEIISGNNTTKKYINEKRSPNNQTILDNIYRESKEIQGLVFY